MAQSNDPKTCELWWRLLEGEIIYRYTLVIGTFRFHEKIMVLNKDSLKTRYHEEKNHKS